jgi:Family of unknown function (DUF6510)
MENPIPDRSQQLVLDANAAAGVLTEVFGMEMTAAPTECASCGNQAAIGTLLAFTEAPGIVLRCSACENVVLRLVQTPQATYLDARGAVYLRLARTSA